MTNSHNIETTVISKERWSELSMPVTNSSPVFTEAELRKRITDIVKRGWIRSGRPGNDGSVGNTIEDLLGIPENNLQVADAGQFEIKGKRAQSDALLTLFHLDPGPKQKYPGRSRRSSPVQPILVDKFGWPHKQRKGENSFRLTINTHRETGREQLQTCNEPQRGNSEAHI